MLYAPVGPRRLHGIGTPRLVCSRVVVLASCGVVTSHSDRGPAGFSYHAIRARGAPSIARHRHPTASLRSSTQPYCAPLLLLDRAQGHNPRSLIEGERRRCPRRPMRECPSFAPQAPSRSSQKVACGYPYQSRSHAQCENARLRPPGTIAFESESSLWLPRTNHAPTPNARMPVFARQAPSRLT